MAVSMRCPRCKLSMTAVDAEALVDRMLDHLRIPHEHAPPREHVLDRIARQNETGTERR